MMRASRLMCIALLACGLGGCGLSATQKQDVVRWETEARDLGHPEVRFEEELNPNQAVGLGFLPFGVAGFYVHRPGLGVSGILFWPLSITWTPPVACSSAHQYNYQLLRERVTTLRIEDQARRPPIQSGASLGVRLEELEDLRRRGVISEAEYQQGRRRTLEDTSR